MHHCLHIPEIVWHILNEVDVGCERQTRNQTYYAVAQTCRSLRDPALMWLWRSIPNLAPLVKCVGRDIWIAQSNRNGVKVRFCRRIYESDIATIKRYASLVQHFGPLSRHSTPSTSVTIDAWEILKRCLEDDVLFPNIRSIFVTKDQTMKFIALFSVHRLTSFVLDITSFPLREHELQAALLAEFAINCPGMKSADFYAPSTLEPELLKAVLPNWRSLSRFSSHYISLEALRWLSRQYSSTLRYLSFHEIAPDERLSSTMDAYFPLAEEMSIGFGAISDTIRFIDYLPASNHLQSLKIAVKDITQFHEREQLEMLHTIKNRAHHLKELKIRARLFPRRTPRVVHSNAAARLVASEFTMLNCIKFVNIGCFDMADEDIKAMAEGLPLLQVFYWVNRKSQKFHRYKTTIASLAYFAENCPLLSSLGLGFDAQEDKIPQRTSFPATTSRLTRLESLDVSDSPINNPSRAAMFISSIFPGVQSILSNGYPLLKLITTSSAPWQEVWELLQLHK